MVQSNIFTLTELENMIPYERDLYKNFIKESNKKKNGTSTTRNFISDD
jgi:hypothetical protein